MDHRGKPGVEERGDYYQQYIDKVEADDLLVALAEQDQEIEAMFSGLDEERGRHRYAPGKWSVKEVLGHLIDSERVFAFRALSVARGETQDLPGFEEDDYVAASNYHERSLASVREEFRTVRQATRSLFEGLADESLVRIGHANGSPCSPRAIGWIVVGHARHHFGVIRERYR